MTQPKWRQRPLPTKPACWAWPMPDDHRDYSAEGMFVWHRSRCAICADGPRVFMDHDHGTGLVRGLLCQRCNIAEAHHSGVFARYRLMPPAFLFQIELRYIPPMNDSGWAYRQWRGA